MPQIVADRWADAGRNVALKEMLDDGQDGSTLAQSKRSRISRLILAGLVGALLGYQFGWKAFCAWIA